MTRFVPRASGWLRDIPDFRDFHPETLQVHEELADLPISKRTVSGCAHVDLRECFPDVHDQESIQASSAHACVGIVEYFEMRSHGKVGHLSPLYLYKCARQLMRLSGDTGIGLRTCIKAMVRFGTPPEYHYPYDVSKYDQQPDPFLQSFADEFRTLIYVRLDRRNSTGSDTLETVKAFLIAGFPVVFGFPIPSSISSDADIPYRPTLDTTCGGQAVVAVGFDNERLRTSKGALLVRSSWGTSWGEDGYGWLPYGYVEQQLATDFWTVLRPDWLASGEYSRPRLRRPRQVKIAAEGPASAGRKTRPR